MKIKELLSQKAWWHLNKTIVKMFDVETALFLSVISEAETLLADEDGWFYQTIPTIEKICGLSKRKQNKAIKLLLENNVIEMNKKGIPPKRHFKLNYHALDVKFTQWEKQIERNGQIEKSETVSNKEHTYKEHNNKEKNINSSEMYSAFSFLIFQDFIKRYKNFFSYEHPFYKIQLLSECLLDLDNIIEMLDLDKMEDWEQIIETYFVEFSKKHTDCSFRLFVNEKTIENYYNRYFL